MTNNNEPIFVTHSAKAISEMEFPEPNWFIPDVLTEGTCLLAGRPKFGKSWAALDLGISVATGGTAFGKYQTPKFDVLYLAIEDHLRRIQSRLDIVMGSEDKPENLEFSCGLSFENVNALSEKINRYFTENQNCKLIIVDTIGRVPGLLRGRGQEYQQLTKVFSKFQEIAFEHNALILVIHHSKKSHSKDDDDFDGVLGSTGYTSVCDTLLLLKRGRFDKEATLAMTGRDIEERKINLKFSENCVWVADEAPVTSNISGNRQKIIDAINNANKALTPKELDEVLSDMTYDNIRQTLRRMTSDNLLEKVNSTYSVVTESQDEQNTVVESASSVTSQQSQASHSHDTTDGDREEEDGDDNESQGSHDDVTGENPVMDYILEDIVTCDSSDSGLDS